MRFADDFWTSKTTITGITAIVVAVIGSITHHITWPQAMTSIFAALQSIFIRDTIAKKHV